MYDLPTVLNGLAVRMKAFGMIVIGRQDQLCCLSNYNPVVQTKSQHPHCMAI